MHSSIQGNTALMLACWKGLEIVVLKMLEAGFEACNAGQVNHHGYTALTLAHRANLDVVVLALLINSSTALFLLGK